jgi:hypothetical protein
VHAQVCSRDPVKASVDPLTSSCPLAKNSVDPITGSRRVVKASVDAIAAFGDATNAF